MRKALQTVFLMGVVIVGIGVVISNKAIAQHDHGGSGGMSMPMPQPSSGPMTEESKHAKQMKKMAKKPKELREHLTAMVSSEELRPALLNLLREDMQLRSEFEKLVNESTK